MGEILRMCAVLVGNQSEVDISREMHLYRLKEMSSNIPATKLLTSGLQLFMLIGINGPNFESSSRRSQIGPAMTALTFAPYLQGQTSYFPTLI